MGKKEGRASAKADKGGGVATVEANAANQFSIKSLRAACRRFWPHALCAGACLPVLVALFWPQHLIVIAIDRVAVQDMSVPRFVRDFAAQRPVVVTGAWNDSVWRPQRVASSCPLARIRTFRHDKRSLEWGHLVQVGVMPLQQYVEAHLAQDASRRPNPLLYGFEMPLKFHCPSLLEAVSIPGFLTEDAFHLVTNRTGLGWPSVLVGPRGSETGLHIDTHRLPFWIAVSGEAGVPLKRFRVFPHDDRGLLKYGKSTGSNNFHFDFDPWQPNFRRHPGLAESFAFEAELYSGDFLYIPGGSPHAVINLADNAGVSMNYLDLKTMPEFIRKGSHDSPLYNVLKGKGEWILEALEERRRQGKTMNYFEFAGIHDREDFCEVHRDTKDGGERPAALEAFCSSADG